MAEQLDTGTETTDAGETQVADAAKPTDAGTSPEAKGTETKAPETKDEKPVEYDIKAPDGIELDTAQVDQFKAIAQELKLPPEKAQALADIAIKAEAARREAFAQQVQTWGEELKADKELGNAENQSKMVAVVDKFGTPELKALLNNTGMGNHPVIARFVFNISKALSEDTIHGKAAGEAPPTDAASILYPTHNKA